LAVRSAVIRLLRDERTWPPGRRFANTEGRGVEGSEGNFHCPKVPLIIGAIRNKRSCVGGEIHSDHSLFSAKLKRERLDTRSKIGQNRHCTKAPLKIWGNKLQATSILTLGLPEVIIVPGYVGTIKRHEREYEGALTIHLNSNEKATKWFEMKAVQVSCSMHQKRWNTGAMCKKKSRSRVEEIRFGVDQRWSLYRTTLGHWADVQKESIRFNARYRELLII
jgi:hypothetical protein